MRLQDQHVQCIVLIATMHITQLRQADLNLLIVFTVLAEERNVSRAAARLTLSQPAVTRAMQRLRDMFQDDLLVRVSGNYELTPKGERLVKELETTLPRLDRLLASAEFDPTTETARFRLMGTDYAAHVIGIPLAKHFLEAGKNLAFDILPLNDEMFDAMDRGRIDLLLYADDGNVPTHIARQILFEEEFVCVVAKSSPYAHKLTLHQYLGGLHVGVNTLAGHRRYPGSKRTNAKLPIPGSLLRGSHTHRCGDRPDSHSAETHCHLRSAKFRVKDRESSEAHWTFHVPYGLASAHGQRCSAHMAP